MYHSSPVAGDTDPPLDEAIDTLYQVYAVGSADWISKLVTVVLNNDTDGKPVMPAERPIFQFCTDMNEFRFRIAVSTPPEKLRDA